MKQIFKLIVAIMIMAIAIDAHAAKNEDVTLIVTSDGTTKDEAIKNALRSAIEQTYGVFVSANTDILNDEVVSDEIATVASGNIKSYKELSVSQSETGATVTLEAVVSVGKLISYAKSKGADVDFDGASMFADIQLQELYKLNEEKAIENIVKQTKEIFKEGVDYKLNISSDGDSSKGMAYGASQYRSPVNNNEIVLAVTISGALNELGEKAFSDLLNSLSCISLSGPNYTDFCTVSSKLQKISPQLPVLEYYRAVGKVAKNCKNFLSRAECNTVYIAPMYDIFSNPTFILPIPGSPSTRDGNNPEFSVFWTLRSRESVNMLNALFSNINELLSSYEWVSQKIW